MKICSKCKINKPPEEFGNRTKASDGKRSACKTCESSQKQKYYQNNKSIIIEKNKKYKANEDKEASKLYKQKYNKSEKGKITRAKYYQNNKEKLKERSKNYKKSENGKLSSAATSNKRRADKIGSSDNTITAQTLCDLLTMQSNKCYYCSIILDKNVNKHLDHYMPISKGGTHSISNVVWSCSKCNLTKSATIPDKPLRNEHTTFFKSLK